MDDRIFREREKAMEENFFRQQDAKLLDKLRQQSKLDEVAAALVEKLGVDNPELLVRARELGITADTAAAFLLAPLVQVAWAEGTVTKREREAVLTIARERGVEDGSKAQEQLNAWLTARPDDALFDAAVEVIKVGLEVLPPKEKEQRIKRITDACHKVAEASGSEIARLLGLGDGVSSEETSILDTINHHLRAHR